MVGGLIGRAWLGRGGLEGTFDLLDLLISFPSAEAASLSSCPLTAAVTLLSLDALLATEEVFECIGFFPLPSCSFSNAFAASASSILFFLASFASACFFATS